MSGIMSTRSVVFQIDEKETAVAGRLRNIKNSENVLSRKLFASRQLNGSLHGLHRSAQCLGVIEGTSPSRYRNNRREQNQKCSHWQPLGSWTITRNSCAVYGGIMAELISELIGERDRPHTRKGSPSQSEADIV